jgi:DNA polymerase-1
LTKRKLFYVIDGSGYIFRAYYGIRPLSSPSGEPANAVFGFANMIQRMLDDDQPEYIAITFDTKAKTFRSDLYEDYKAHRPPPPEDLIPQFARIHQVTEAFQLPLFKQDGFEADDFIATLTQKALAEDFDVKVITGDKDLMQLVNDRVTLWEPMREKLYRPPQVEEKFGVLPDKIGDLLALMGDSSDNIPGVRGVGPKTASKLLSAHGDLEGVLKAAQEGRIKGKICEKIASGVDLARLSRQLVELKDDIDIKESIEELRYTGPNTEAQIALYRELGFQRLLARAESGADNTTQASSTPSASPKKSVQGNYRLVQSSQALQDLLKTLRTAKRLAFCMENESSRMIDSRIFGFGVAWAEGEAAYIATGDITVAEILHALQEFLENPKLEKIFSTVKPWYALAQLHEFDLKGVRLDTSIASYLIDADDRYETSSAINHGPDDGPHGISDIARKFLNTTSIARSSITGTGRQRRKIEDIPAEELRDFVAQRADFARRSATVLKDELALGHLDSVLDDIELPLASVLAKLELTGVSIDVELLSGLESRFAEELVRLEKRCYELAGEEFKVNSPKQLREILFDKLKLKIIKRTKTGPSTDHSVLEELACMHE